MGKYNTEPRMMPVDEVMSYLHVSGTTFHKYKDEWIKSGFPKPNPILSKPRKPMYDKKLLDKWLDEIGGVKSRDEALSDELIEKARSGKV